MTGYASSVPRIAVLGAGHTGPVIARVATEAGYPVSIAASGDPELIELITTVLAPGAEPRWAADAIRDADIVVLAIPLHRFATLDPALLAGKIVVDTMNYWPPTDGVQAAFEDPRYGSSEIVQHRLAGRRSSRPSTTSATTSWTRTAGRAATRSAARWASPATTRPRWRSWPRSSTGSGTTRSGSVAFGTGAFSSPGDRSSASRCAATSSSPPSRPRPSSRAWRRPP